MKYKYLKRKINSFLEKNNLEAINKRFPIKNIVIDNDNILKKGERNMKLKNLDLTDDGKITIITHVAGDVFAIECDKKSFAKMKDINLDVENVRICSKHLYICTLHKTTKTSTVNAIKIISRAFKNNLIVLDVQGAEIKKDDFTSIYSNL